MSTHVDKKPRIPAAETRVRILAAARLAFCRAGFDQIGVRELAADAGADPAVVIRLFVSKEALFAAVAADAFGLEPPFDGPLAGLGIRIARFLTGKAEACDDPPAFDAFRFLLHSAASPVAAPILSRSLHESFIDPLARHLGGSDAPARAALLAATVLGFVTLRLALASPALEGATERLGACLQACLDA